MLSPKKKPPGKRPPGKKIVKRPPGKKPPKVVLKDSEGNDTITITTRDLGFWKEPAPPASGYQVVDGGVVCEMDAIGLLKSLEDESVDLAIFDPAYESLEKHRKTGTTTRLSQSKASSNDWFCIFPNTAYWPLFEQLYRVMKKGTFIFMFCDQETRDMVVYGRHPDAKPISDEGQMGPLIESGFKLWKSVIWDKEHQGMGYHFRAQHEFIVLAEKVERKGKHRKLNNLGMGDVLKHTRLKGKDYYPTEKPLSLLEDLVLQGSNEGDLVLDFFAGSGVTGEACRKNGRSFILGDLKTKQIIERLT